MRPLLPRDATWYRAALYLYPPAFRREFGPDMLRDFADARQESTSLWAFRMEFSMDLAKSIVLQWVRHRLPLIVLIAMTGPLIVTSLLLRVFNAMSFVPPPVGPDRDLVALELLITVVLFVVVTTIVFVSWYLSRIMRRIPPRRRFVDSCCRRAG